MPREAEEFRSRALDVLWEPQFGDWGLGRYPDHLGASEPFHTAIL